MKPHLALIAIGVVLGSGGAGALVGHAAQVHPAVDSASQVDQRIDDISQQIADAHRMGALDFSQAHAIDRELTEVRGREHRMKFHGHGVLVKPDADVLQSQLDQLADELHDSANAGRTAEAAPGWDPSRA